MRRLLLALLFPLLLIAQQEAFVHSLEHFSAAVGASRSPDDRQTSSDQYCEKCFTFAQVGAAADLTPVFAAVLTLSLELIGFRLPIAPPSLGRLPRNRGPPFSL